MVNMDSWMQTEMVRILLNEVIEREWLDHMPFLHVTTKEWRSLEFWGSGSYLFKNITYEEWEAQPSPKPRVRTWKAHPGSAKANWRKPKTGLGRDFNSKLGYIATPGSKCMVCIQPLLKL